ncbi:MAG TPA: hypothetical protein VKQ73_03495 [Stellaceae bacterium]|nr:hypothetical protein [Stellaceae bacterium]
MQVLSLESGIDFGAAGNLKDYSPIGFSPVPDDISTWSEASVAGLTFRLAPLRHDLRFSVEVFPFLADGQIAQQNCWVFLNGLFVHYQPVRAPIEIAFTVARDLLAQRIHRLSFALPDAAAPKALGLGDDLRLLGLSFVKLAAGDPAAAPPRKEEAAARDGGPARRRAEPAAPPPRPRPPRREPARGG